jgi:hypothetical protein
MEKFLDKKQTLQQSLERRKTNKNKKGHTRHPTTGPN